MRIVDWELLDCVVCFQPLCPPLYLCLNGHQTCGKCSPRIKNCSLCNAVPSGGRNVAMEKLLDAIQMPCPNQRFGCCRVFPYYKLVEHLTECLFAVTCCPEPCCTFSSYPHGTVIAHGMSNHRCVVLLLTIGETNVFSIANMEPFSFIRDDKGRDYVAFMKHNGREMKFALLLLQGPESRNIPNLNYTLSVRVSDDRGTSEKLVTLTGPVLPSFLGEGMQMPNIFLTFSCERVSPIVDLVILEED